MMYLTPTLTKIEIFVNVHVELVEHVQMYVII